MVVVVEAVRDRPELEGMTVSMKSKDGFKPMSGDRTDPTL